MDCVTCNGNGEVVCYKCGGDHAVAVSFQGNEMSETSVCENCSGTGHVTCHHCFGNGNIE